MHGLLILLGDNALEGRGVESDAFQWGSSVGFGRGIHKLCRKSRRDLPDAIRPGINQRG